MTAEMEAIEMVAENEVPTIARVRRNGRKSSAGVELEGAAREGLLFITRAFQGAVRLDDKENRQLLSAASTIVGNWARYRASTSAMEATQFAMASMLAKDGAGRLVDMMKLTMPAHHVTRALLGKPTVLIGDGDESD